MALAEDTISAFGDRNVERKRQAKEVDMSTVSKFTPRWDDDLPADDTLVACLHGAWERYDLVSLLVAADRLEELGADSRAAWIRAACDLWREAEAIQPGEAGEGYWTTDDCYAALTQCGVTQDAKAWRAAGLWSVLVGAFAPAGDGSGRRMYETMYETWTDARVREGSFWLWLWGCGLVDSGQAYEVYCAANVAATQADVAAARSCGSDAAFIAAHRHYATSYQAAAVCRQAEAVMYPAEAVHAHRAAITEIAYAAWYLAEAAWYQADAAAYQAGTPRGDGGNEAWRRVTRYARGLWPLVWERCQSICLHNSPVTI